MEFYALLGMKEANQVHLHEHIHEILLSFLEILLSPHYRRRMFKKVERELDEESVVDIFI